MKHRKVQLVKMLIYGKNSIKERLNTNPKSIKQLFVQDNFSDRDLIALAQRNNIHILYKNEWEMRRTKRADRLQGLIAEIEPFRYARLEDILDGCQRDIIFLDELNDPQNLGSIIRIAACFGNFAVCLPEFGSCSVNETVLHVASGGENYVPIVRAPSLSFAIKKAKEKGYVIVGTAVEGGKDLSVEPLPFPLGIIMGSEGKGISNELKKYIDLNLTIPMRGAKLSFNVAMATSIFCFEIARQRLK